MICVGPAGWMIVQYGKNFHVAIFSDTITVINVKLCMMALHTELYLSYQFQSPWLCFKVTAVSNNFNWKFYDVTWVSWNFIGLLSGSSISWMYRHFWGVNIFKEDNWHIPSFEENFVEFFFHTIKAKSVTTLHDLNLAWGPNCPSRFDDLNLV